MINGHYMHEVQLIQ